MTDLQPSGLRARIRRSALPGVLALCVLLAVTVAGAGCTRSSANANPSQADREATLRQIASDYLRSEDLAQAQAALDKLGVANPGQLLLSLAEADIVAGRGRADIEPLAQLVDALGIHSPKLIAYLAPTAMPTVTPVPPTATALPPTATLIPTATSEPPTATAEPPTATPTPEPQQARVISDSAINLRSGPGRAYPVIGQMRAGQELPIIGRNASGDWWQLAWQGQAQAWVAGTVVSVLGPIDTVAVAQNIPAPPPQPTAAPRPTAAPQPPAGPTAAPKPSTEFVVQSLRLRSVGEDSQRCDGGDHNIFVTVVDAAGNAMDNVRVREIFTGQIQVTGVQGKGSGRVQFDIYRGGGGQIEIVNGADERISDVSRGMSDDWPDFDLMKAAGYCNCKPHPDDASCEADLRNKTYLFAVGHYAYEVVFRRTY